MPEETAMTPQERARKIIQNIDGMFIRKQSDPVYICMVKEVAYEIEAAEREAFKQGRSTEDMRVKAIKDAHDRCAHNAEEIRAEGFRAARDKAVEILETEGFASGTITEFRREIAERIRELKSDA